MPSQNFLADARAGRDRFDDRFAVDPSVISSLMRSNASKQTALDDISFDEMISDLSQTIQTHWPERHASTAMKRWEISSLKSRHHMADVDCADIAPVIQSKSQSSLDEMISDLSQSIQAHWPKRHASIAMEVGQASSWKSSRHTEDFDGYDSEITSADSCTACPERCFASYVDPLPVGPVDGRKEKPPARESLPVPTSGPSPSHWQQNTSRKEANRFAKRPSGVKDADPTTTFGNSLDAFAAAWKVAECTGAWKEDQQPEQTRWQKVPKKSVLQEAAKNQPLACEDMPLPKWFKPSTSLVRDASPSAGVVRSPLEEGLFLMGVTAIRRSRPRSH